jgi:predicted NodU family carbamoyl transferase
MQKPITLSDLLETIKGKSLTDIYDEPIKILIRTKEDEYKLCTLASFGYASSGDEEMTKYFLIE